LIAIIALFGSLKGAVSALNVAGRVATIIVRYIAIVTLLTARLDAVSTAGKAAVGIAAITISAVSIIAGL
jgi:hypothetical protein